MAKIICLNCKKLYHPNPHYNRKKGNCSLECRRIWTNKTKAQYKKTKKGVESEKRWRLNPEKKIIDERYRRTEHAKKLNLLRVKKNIQKSEYTQKERPRLMKLYRLTRQNKTGKYRIWWLKKTALGCARCGTKERKLTIDHIIPRIKGGSDEIKNLQVLCMKCNGEKGWGRKKESKIWSN